MPHRQSPFYFTSIEYNSTSIEYNCKTAFAVLQPAKLDSTPSASPSFLQCCTRTPFFYSPNVQTSHSTIHCPTTLPPSLFVTTNMRSHHQKALLHSSEFIVGVLLFQRACTQLQETRRASWKTALQSLGKVGGLALAC